MKGENLGGCGRPESRNTTLMFGETEDILVWTG